MLSALNLFRISIFVLRIYSFRGARKNRLKDQSKVQDVRTHAVFIRTFVILFYTSIYVFPLPKNTRIFDKNGPIGTFTEGRPFSNRPNKEFRDSSVEPMTTIANIEDRSLHQLIGPGLLFRAFSFSCFEFVSDFDILNFVLPLNLCKTNPISQTPK